MSQHSKNTEQSPLDPDMENEAEQVATTVVSEISERAAANIDELMQAIRRWKAAAEGSVNGSAGACGTNQKLERELHKFFNMRRVFAEHCGDKDLDEEMNSRHLPTTSKTQKTEGQQDRKFSSKFKSALKHYFRRKPKKKVNSEAEEEEGEDVDEDVDEEESTPGILCAKETSSRSEDTTAPIKLSTAEENLICQAPSDSNQQSEKQTGKDSSIVHKTIKSVCSIFRKKENNAQTFPDQHEEEAAETGSQLFSPPQVASSLTSAIKSDLSTAPLAVMDLNDKDEDVTPVYKFVAEDLVTDLYATPGTSQVQFETEHVDEVIEIATCDSPSKDFKTSEMSPAEDIKDRTQVSTESDSETDSDVFKKMCSMWNVFRKKKSSKVHPLPVQHKEEAAGSDSPRIPSSSPPLVASTHTSVHSSEEIRTSIHSNLSTASVEPVYLDNEDEDVTQVYEFVAEDLITDLYATPGTSQVQLEAEHVDEVIEIATSDSPSKDFKTSEMSPTEDIRGTADADRTQVSTESDSETDSDVFTKMCSMWNVFRKKKSSKVHPLPVQNKEEAAGSDSPRIPSSSPPLVASTHTSVHSSEDIRASIHSNLSTAPQEVVDLDNEDEDVTQVHEFVAEDLVTDLYATPGTSQVQLETEHVDEVIEIATSDSPSKDIKTSEMSPTEDIKDRTQVSTESDSETDSDVFTKMCSMWNVFRKKKSSKVHSLPVQHKDEAAGSDSPRIPSSSPPLVAFTHTSVHSSEDIRTSIHSNLSTASVEPVYVDDEDEDVTHVHKFVEDDLVTDLYATPGTSQVQLEAEHVDEVIEIATSDSPSKDFKTSEMSPAASACSTEDIRGTADADRTQVSTESDSETDSDVFTKMCSMWNVFRKKKSSKVHSLPVQHKEEAAGSDSPRIPSSSPPLVASTHTSVHSSEDIRTSIHSNLSTAPQEAVDLDNEDEDVTQVHEFMEDDLVTDLYATPGTSQVQLETEHVDEVIEIATSDSPSKHFKTSEMSPAASACSTEDIRGTADADRTQVSTEFDSETDSNVFKKMWKVLKKKKSNNVHSLPVQHKEEAAGSDSQRIPSSSPPLVASTHTSVHSSEDIRTSIHSNRSTAPVEVVDLDDNDISWNEEKENGLELPTIHSSPLVEHCKKRSSVTEEVMVMDRDSTPGPSSQERQPKSCVAVERHIGLKNTFYYIIMKFFKSLSDREVEEIKKGVYDIKEQIVEMCFEVLKLVIDSITGTVSQAITVSPTCSQERSTEQVNQSVDITNDDIQKSLKSSFGEALHDMLGPDRRINISPNFTMAIMKTVTNEFNSSLAQTIEVSLDGDISSGQYSSCRECKKTLTGVVRSMESFLTGQGHDNVVKLSSGDIHYWCPQATSTSSFSKSSSMTNEEDFPSPYSVGYYPSTNLNVPDYEDSSPAAETQCSDSSAEMCNRSCLISCKCQKKEEMAAPADNDTVRTNRPLWKRIHKFCCRLCCCSHNNVQVFTL